MTGERLRRLRRAGQDLDELGQPHVADHERTHEVGVRRRPVCLVLADGITERRVAGREDRRVVDETDVLRR